jgi:hypothetical protein
VACRGNGSNIEAGRKGEVIIERERRWVLASLSPCQEQIMSPSSFNTTRHPIDNPVSTSRRFRGLKSPDDPRQDAKNALLTVIDPTA